MLSQYIHIIDFRHVTAVKRIDSKTSMDDLISFALENLSHSSHNVRMACTTILKQLASGLIAADLATMQQQNESVEASKEITESWHLLHKFHATIERHQEAMREYREEFRCEIVYLIYNVLILNHYFEFFVFILASSQTNLMNFRMYRAILPFHFYYCGTVSLRFVPRADRKSVRLMPLS